MLSKYLNPPVAATLSKIPVVIGSNENTTEISSNKFTKEHIEKLNAFIVGWLKKDATLITTLVFDLITNEMTGFVQKI